MALNRVLGRWDLVLLFVVAITNLNVVPVVAAGGPASLWLWLLALVLFFWPQGISVIELSQRYPGEGGIYLWTREELGPLHGFLSGWCYWTNNIFYVPTVLFYLVGVSVFVLGPEARGLADNKAYLFGMSVGLLWVLTAVNVVGLGVGKWVNNLGGIGTAIACLALMGLGLAAGEGRNLSLEHLRFERLDLHLVSSFGVVCFALVGLELASVMGDEIREPRRTLPGAVLWGGILSGVLYVGATLAILISVPQQDIGVLNGVMQAIEKMAQAARVPWVVAPLAVVLTVSIVGIASAWFAGSARIPFVAGIDHYLPPALGQVHPRFGTPHVALLVQAVLSTLIIGMSFVGASVKEAFVTLLDLAVVLQLVPYLYVYAILIRFARAQAPAPAFFAKPTLGRAGWVGLATTLVGMVVAFVPSRQIDSIWAFETKLVLGCASFLGLAVLFYWRGSAATAKTP